MHEGEFVSVMGPSGSGKTTLLNCCSGLDDIDGGRVLLDGVDLHALSDARRTANRASSMGFIFQAYNLIPVFSAVENAELPLLLAGVDAKEARRRASETLERVGLGSALEAPSGGALGRRAATRDRRARARRPASGRVGRRADRRARFRDGRAGDGAAARAERRRPHADRRDARRGRRRQREPRDQDARRPHRERRARRPVRRSRAAPTDAR